MKKIAIIGANKPLLPFYKQTKKLGYYIIGIAWEEGAVCKEYCDKFYPVSFKEKKRVLDICRKENIDGITSFSLESALPTVVYVAQSLGLTSNKEECVELTKTKYSQRKAFEKAGVPVPCFFRISNVTDLPLINLTYPIIVKPIDSGGSQGITLLHSKEHLEEAFLIAKNYSPTEEVIVEEFVDGREFSVECMSYKGRHYLVQITDKVTTGEPHFIEMQHHQPANITLHDAQRIQEIVFHALTALKIENSPSHTEIKLNTRGELYIIEIGARMGGGMITSNLVKLSTGYDMVKAAIELACGNFLEPKISNAAFSGILFYSQLSPEVGEVIRHHRNRPEVVECEISDETMKELKSNADRMGYFIYMSMEHRIDLNSFAEPLVCEGLDEC